jgi:biotin transport system substrate-specific component
MTTSSADTLAQRRPAATLADLLAFPGFSPALRSVLLVAGGAALTALAAQVAFTVPWTPVPYTLQTGAVLLVGTALGMWRGAAAMGLYVLAGSVGLPVYAEGAAGLDRLLGFSGGYLVAFVLAAALVGRLAQLGWDRTWWRTAVLMVGGTLLIYALGVPVLAATTGMAIGDAIWNGAAVFVPWDAAKVAIAMLGLPLAWRLVGRQSRE